VYPQGGGDGVTPGSDVRAYPHERRELAWRRLRAARFGSVKSFFARFLAIPKGYDAIIALCVEAIRAADATLAFAVALGAIVSCPVPISGRPNAEAKPKFRKRKENFVKRKENFAKRNILFRSAPRKPMKSLSREIGDFAVLSVFKGLRFREGSKALAGRAASFRRDLARVVEPLEAIGKRRTAPRRLSVHRGVSANMDRTPAT
jgi:hypothetical protein